MTDMPEVIYAQQLVDDGYSIRFEKEFILVENAKFKSDNGENPYVVLGVLFDKHEELKAIADKMDSVFEYCEFIMSNAGLDCLPIYNVRTEYNKYKGE